MNDLVYVIFDFKCPKGLSYFEIKNLPLNKFPFSAIKINDKIWFSGKLDAILKPYIDLFLFNNSFETT